MNDFSGYTFTANSNGQKYTLMVVLQSNDKTKTFTLNTSYIKNFEYTQQLNDLNLVGSLEYIDLYGKLDNFLDEQYCICEVFFAQHSQFFDGLITCDCLDFLTNYQLSFVKKFVVQGISIIERNANQIIYKLKLIDSLIYKTMSKIQFSNYSETTKTTVSSDASSILDIFKVCLERAGFTVDTKTFDKVKTNVKINYITYNNNNINDIIFYLFNKLYYYTNMLDDSLKFFFVNDKTEKCQLFDLKNIETVMGVYPVVLSFSKNKTEGLFEKEEIKIASITHYPQSISMDNIFQKKIIDYDYASNKINDDLTIESSTITNYMNNSFNSNDYKIKFKSINNIDDCNLVNYISYWNNNANIYWNAVQTMMNTNALIFETCGNIARQVSSILNIAIDRSLNELTNEDPKSLNDLMTRYNGLDGEWFIFRIHHIIEPMSENYKQIISVMRNFNTI